MATYTARWGLSILGPGDALQDDGYKFTDADRRLIDRVLAYAAEQHHHSGDVGSDLTPLTAPSLTLLTTGGAMASSSRFYYEVTVVDALGNESAPSPMAAIDTPPAITAPGAPALSYLTGSGSLLPGSYSYVLSAYKGANSLETKATNSAVVTIGGSGSSNSISLILPALPLGADGLNVYRKSPTGLHYLYLTTIASPTNGQVWIDDGSLDGDCDRSLPSVNRTSNTNAVSIGFPGATPYLPDGWRWRIYRTAVPSDWSRSFLTEVTPIGATPVLPLSYDDVGAGTRIGAPPTAAQIINAPSKIQLTDGAEVAGYLPPGRLVVPQVISFTLPGPVTVGAGTFTWVCPFDEADIISVRAFLGVDSTPVAQAVIVDVNANRPSKSETWGSIFDGTKPQVPVGQSIGTPVTPVKVHLAAGDALAVDVDQAGGGATPADSDLTVNILLYTKDGSDTASYTWSDA